MYVLNTHSLRKKRWLAGCVFLDCQMASDSPSSFPHRRLVKKSKKWSWQERREIPSLDDNRIRITGVLPNGTKAASWCPARLDLRATVVPVTTQWLAKETRTISEHICGCCWLVILACCSILTPLFAYPTILTPVFAHPTILTPHLFRMIHPPPADHPTLPQGRPSSPRGSYLPTVIPSVPE